MLASEGNSGWAVRSGENFAPLACEKDSFHLKNTGFVINTEDGGQSRGPYSKISL